MKFRRSLVMGFCIGFFLHVAIKIDANLRANRDAAYLAIVERSVGEGIYVSDYATACYCISFHDAPLCACFYGWRDRKPYRVDIWR